jgi:hypothetical protein
MLLQRELFDAFQVLQLTFNQDWSTLDVSASPPLAEFTVADLTCGTEPGLTGVGLFCKPEKARNC